MRTWRVAHMGVLSLALTAPALAADTPADAIWRGGPIVTVDDAKPFAEAVAVRGGRIVAAGSESEVMRLRGPKTRVIDLAGKTLVPGFIDGHGHVSMIGFQAVSAASIEDASGSCDDHRVAPREREYALSVDGDGRTRRLPVQRVGDCAFRRPMRP